MEALTNIGGFLGSTAGKGILGLGTAGAGLIQNLMAARQANQKQKFVQDLITNPAKFNALVAQTEQPLSKGLTTDVARQAQAFGAERGLGSSGPVMQDVFAQALAPYQQQEQQMAINSLLSRLGTYASTPTMPPVDVSSIFKALAMGGGGTAPTAKPLGGTDVGTIDPSVWAPMGGPMTPDPTYAGSATIDPTVDVGGGLYGGY